MGDEDRKRSAMPRNRSGDHHNQNKTSEEVDGVRVYGKFYPKGEWSKLNSKQKAAVLKLKRLTKRPDSRVKGSEESNSHIKALRESMKDDLISVGDAIVASVSQRAIASVEESKEDASTIVSVIAGSQDKRSASSGSVGE